MDEAERVGRAGYLEPDAVEWNRRIELGNGRHRVPVEDGFQRIGAADFPDEAEGGVGAEVAEHQDLQRQAQELGGEQEFRRAEVPRTNFIQKDGLAVHGDPDLSAAFVEGAEQGGIHRIEVVLGAAEQDDGRGSRLDPPLHHEHRLREGDFHVNGCLTAGRQQQGEDREEEQSEGQKTQAHGERGCASNAGSRHMFKIRVSGHKETPDF